MSARWWTAADDAELDVLLFELVDGYFAHRDRCHDVPCPHVGRAVEAVLDWRHARSLRSRATFFRAAQDFADWGVVA